MPLRVQCAAGHLMMVPDHRAGTVLRCPNCGIDVQVPAAGGTGKELVKPRVNPPPTTPAKAGVGAARQSAQVAGHSTAAKSGTNRRQNRAPNRRPCLLRPRKPRRR
jgi:hypothetical protein